MIPNYSLFPGSSEKPGRKPKDVLAPLFHSFGNLINHVEGSVDQIRIVNACLNLLDHLVPRVVSFIRVLAISSN